MVGLKTYQRKRDFAKTREPRGVIGKVKGHRYVIQKHDARRLHYDLRLELDGVMLSWAVTKGPSLVPGDKRLAIHVEDHPVEYNRFEGTIPKGEYGGGTVMVWDRGTWTPEGDPHKGMAKGHLDFELKGEKLKGRFHLVRMRKRPGERQEPWLLIKSDDEFARAKSDPDILEQKSKSVVTGRSIEQIAKNSTRVWHSNRQPDDQPQARSRAAKPRAAVKARPSGRKTKARATRKKSSAGKSSRKPEKSGKRQASGDLVRIEGVRRAKLPDFVPPCLATLSANAPDGERWIHEIKFDGYRMQARLSDGAVRLRTRSGLDWTGKFPTIAEAVCALPAKQALLDGEIVSQNAQGISDFSALQNDLKAGRGDRLIYYVFDLLYLDGCDLTRAALRDRARVLARLLQKVPASVPIRLSEPFDTPGPILLKHACRMDLEGIISKRADAPYRSGRGGEWIKTKCTANQEFVVGGYEPSDKAARSIRALLLGYYDGKKFRYAGRVGTGFSVALERDLLGRLKALARADAPFEAIPKEEARRKIKWVEPALVAEIDFRGWTHGDVLRQASFKGLREDKKAGDVVREMPRKSAAAAQAGARKTSRGAPAKRAGKTARKVGPKKRAETAARSATSKKSPVSVAGVTLTHPDRVYWADAGVTKRMLADFYADIWDRIAPHLVNRPIALVRCPDGADSRKCFFQKHVSAGLEGERLKSIPLKGEQPAIAVHDLAGLIALVQAGVLEIHCWGTHAGHIESCDQLVFDLDPGPGVSFKQLVGSAREVRARLKDLKLESFVKTTGGKGLHVVVPIVPADWDKAKDFAHAIARMMAEDDPQLYVATMSKKLRDRRIFVDYLRNGRGATAIAPYSTRARDGAPVATPLAWEELGSLKAANQYTVLNLEKRLSRLRRDPWGTIGKVRQRLPAV
jgi:bifunctional non-homologous end joining protein LigD